MKYEFLVSNDFASLDWEEIITNGDETWRITKTSSESYKEYINIIDFFPNSSPCIRTHNDKELIGFEKFKTEFNQKYLYKAFDIRYVDFDLKKIGRPRIKIMKEFLSTTNLGIVFQRGSSSETPNTPFVTNIISDQGAIKPGTTSTSTVAPLYLYPETTAQQTTRGLNPLPFENKERIPNLNPEIVKQIAAGLGMVFTNEKETTANTFAPIDLLEYIYAVLHSPTYREKYKEFLKIDFPRVPYPKDLTTFKKLSNLGSELRQIHLLESPIVEKYITQYPEDGDNVVGKPRLNLTGFENLSGLGRVYINETQYFDNVPEVAWNFYIGGYQPAQKWLKDRKERELSYEDILYYQKIIVALNETDRIMKEIDTIEI